jgi:hypothetical protein
VRISAEQTDVRMAVKILKDVCTTAWLSVRKNIPKAVKNSDGGRRKRKAQAV